MPTFRANDDVNSSIDSTKTEPAVVSPTLRRRPSFEQPECGPVRHSPSPLNASGRLQHNPYMYNVLGDKASPDMQKRTSPIPAFPATPTQARTLSFENVDELGDASLDARVAGLSPTSPVLGGYAAARFISGSAFSNHSEPSFEIESQLPWNQSQQAQSQASARKKRRGGRNSANAQQVRPLAMPPSTASGPVSPVQATPSSPVVSSPTTGAACVTRVYRNGRPVPVAVPASS